MIEWNETRTTRAIGIALIVFAIGFNIPYIMLGVNFDYPQILRRPPGAILLAFRSGGDGMVMTWAAFAFAALLFAPIAVVIAKVTRRFPGDSATAIAAIGIAAGVTQAIGLSRWIYVVPGLAEEWMNLVTDIVARAPVESTFKALHQFAGVGVGEAIGQTLTAFWLIGVSLSQFRHPRYTPALAWTGIAGGVVLLLGLVEGVATVLDYDPGPYSYAAPVGFLILSVWLIWTGVLCILKPERE